MTRSEIDIDLSGYISRYHRPLAVADACRACPRYGATWACPPFSFNVDDLLSRYTRIRLIACTFTLESAPDFRNIAPIREQLNARVLALEEELRGLACYFGGSCDLCPSCTRPQGRPCRQPHKMRPSLESYGFDLVATLADQFNITLSWASPSPHPITLLGAILHN